MDVCQDWLKYKDRAFIRLLLTIGLFNLNQFPQAEEQVRLALDRDPNDLRCNLALAAVLLRRDDAKSLAEAAKQLERAGRLVDASTPDEQKHHYQTVRAVHAALSGDRDAARKLLDEVLKKDPNDESAKKVLAALE